MHETKGVRIPVKDNVFHVKQNVKEEHHCLIIKTKNVDWFWLSRAESMG